ncbi:MAG: hypothetical protein GF390_01785 [Candidatus Pacebacteria bacterium]|nr:hypothetical protein [Candidatus Paceibacterota bacterium]
MSEVVKVREVLYWNLFDEKTEVSLKLLALLLEVNGLIILFFSLNIDSFRIVFEKNCPPKLEFSTERGCRLGRLIIQALSRSLIED